MEKRPALGKGLSALIPDGGDAFTTPRGSLEVDIDLLEPNHYQPRGAIDDDKLEELARSIRANGVIQPIVVRRAPSSGAGGASGASGAGRDRYQIIAGERRWRAAQRAHLTKVPIVVKDIAAGDKMRLLEMALVENIQREDLNPMEAAAAYQRLVDEFHLKQDDIAAQVGKDRATVANYLRLLKLPAEVRGNVASGALTMGHARAIVALGSEADQRRLARDVVARGLSVRETEALVKHDLDKAQPGRANQTAAKKDVHVRAAEQQLHLSLGTPVEIKRRGKGGTIAITFTSEAELQRIYEYLTEKKK
ncbi:MAG: ParB/RepB/Spo0J family partition protein [Vicinamibacterales bacterium]|nr:ParB/RepB/Spo0J family partition protein [Vicinamibacterales bacterium]